MVKMENLCVFSFEKDTEFHGNWLSMQLFLYMFSCFDQISVKLWNFHDVLLFLQVIFYVVTWTPDVLARSMLIVNILIKSIYI